MSKITEIALKLESQEDRNFIIDLAQRVKNLEEAEIILKQLTQSERLTTAIWKKAFDYFR